MPTKSDAVAKAVTPVVDPEQVSMLHGGCALHLLVANLCPH